MDEQIKSHLRSRYGWIVLHEQLADRAGVKAKFNQRLRKLFGQPQEEEGLVYWRL
jgi:hypothetical protein